MALYLEVPHEQLIDRMLHRGHSEGRNDDTEEVMRHRIDVFDQMTAPLLDYYARREILVRVDGARPVDEVSAAAIAELERVRL